MKKRVIFSISLVVVGMYFLLIGSFGLASDAASVEDEYRVVIGDMTVLSKDQAKKLGCVATVVDKKSTEFCVEDNAMFKEIFDVIKKDTYYVTVMGTTKKVGKLNKLDIEVYEIFDKVIPPAPPEPPSPPVKKAVAPVNAVPVVKEEKAAEVKKEIKAEVVPVTVPEVVAPPEKKVETVAPSVSKEIDEKKIVEKVNVIKLEAEKKIVEKQVETPLADTVISKKEAIVTETK